MITLRWPFQKYGHLPSMSLAVWNQVLEMLYRLDQPQKALGAARVAAKEHAHNPEVFGYIARAYFRGGFPDEAAKLFDKLVAPHSEPVSAVVQSKLLHSEGRARFALDVALRTLRKTGAEALILDEGLAVPRIITRSELLDSLALDQPQQFLVPRLDPLEFERELALGES